MGVLTTSVLGAESRVVRVGIFPAPPLVYSDMEKPTGLFIELIEYFSSVLDWKIEYIPATWSNTLDNLEKNKIDLIPALGYTKERDLKYDFSKHVIYVDSGVLFTNKEFQPHTVFDLQDKRIAALKDSIFTKGFIEYMNSFGIQCEIIYTSDNKAVMEAISNGKANAGVCIYSLGNELAREYPVTATTINFSPIALHFAVLNNKNEDLIIGINQLMSSMIDDPKSFYNTTFNKWTTLHIKKQVPIWIWWSIYGLFFLGIVLIVMIYILKKQIALKTDKLVTEISEKNIALKALEVERNRLDITLRSIGEGVITTDKTGKILMFNKMAEVLTGRSSSDAVGLPLLQVFDIVDEKTHQPCENPVEKVIKTGKAINLPQISLINIDGQEISIADSCSPIKDKYNNTIGVIIVFQDISKSKKMENQLLQSQKMEAVGKLAGGIAHDFNNMLNVILIYGELILEKLNSDDPLQDPVKEIIKAGKRSADLTSQLLAFSRKQTLQPEVLDINELLKNLEKMLRRVIGEDIKLVLNLEENLAIVEVDRSQIEQVILNLVINARDAMPKGGKLLIETANIKLDELYQQNHNVVIPGDYVLIALTDSGHGMKAEILDKIFDPFFTTKEIGKGTGLGLSTVYGIIKQSNGYIWVYSEPEIGTTFKIYLPNTNSSKKTKTNLKEKVFQSNKRAKILIVEDERSLRYLFKKTLTELGYYVTIAANGREAILLIKKKKLKIDLVITDVIMPKMGGFEMVKQLQTYQPDIPVIYMSGYAEETISHHGKLSPDTFFIQKPFNIHDFINKIDEVLNT